MKGGYLGAEDTLVRLLQTIREEMKRGREGRERFEARLEAKISSSTAEIHNKLEEVGLSCQEHQSACNES